MPGVWPGLAGPGWACRTRTESEIWPRSQAESPMAVCAYIYEEYLL